MIVACFDPRVEESVDPEAFTLQSLAISASLRGVTGDSGVRIYERGVRAEVLVPCLDAWVEESVDPAYETWRFLKVTRDTLRHTYSRGSI